MLNPKQAMILLMTTGKELGRDDIHQAFLGASPESLYAFDYASDSARQEKEYDIIYILDTSKNEDEENIFEFQAHRDNGDETVSYRCENWEWVQL